MALCNHWIQDTQRLSSRRSRKVSDSTDRSIDRSWEMCFSFSFHSNAGAYTTTRTVDGASCLLLWERHLARLAQSLHIMRKKAIDQRALTKLVNPSLYAGLEEALARRSDEEELVVTVLACNKDEGPLQISVHITGLVPASTVPAQVSVMGPSRETPLAKSSQWVRTRQVLEQCMPKNTAEVILSNDGRHLLEGLVTNFFVVLSTVGEGSRSVVQTAALGNGVLPGTVRQLVIEICSEKNIPVLEGSPSWDERYLWKEAFVTSSVRLIQPVSKIQMPMPWNASFDPAQWNPNHWDTLSLKAPGSVTKILQKEVLARAKYHGSYVSNLIPGA
ncbi:uncharacterized protein LOC9635860 isoform X1 [Selaginella moellendorffii]|uniref:uncharacterized protein LOC9635860 isoform X1 n=1 Tax=Selaginella moellendorffii TaxID=88036 RepID=UPI000D1C34B9|nr:uncharacterized protein LOC9635860 isoform X1 [Selaginella moellendorffii]|eukprot:XP_024540602.1 uncharacterized protein LOC9635860 isoform X1 [Selaginella moellendorffii]